MIDQPNIMHNETPDDGALIIKYLKELTTPEETVMIENRMNENKEYRNEVKQIAELFFTKRAYDRMNERDPDIAFQKLQFRLQKKEKKNTNLSKTLLYAAASLIGAIILSSTFIYLWENGKISGKTNSIIAETNPGMRSRVTLSDGTTVYLNSGSKLIYPDRFNGNHRTVELDGEAFFHVKKDPDKPFIVNTNDHRASITVLGTSFNIQCFKQDNEFTAALVEGLVNVTVNHLNGSNTSVRLTPSEKIIFNKSSDSLFVSKIDTDIETAWTRDRLVFRNQPMTQVLKTLSYNYNVEFDIKNPAIYSYRFTGTFQSRQLSQILEYIKISSDIDYTINYPHSDDSLGVKKTHVILK